MFTLFKKLFAIVESLVSVVISLSSPSPSPDVIVESAPSVQVSEADKKETIKSSLKITTRPTVSPSPHYQEVIKQLEELKQEIIKYTPEPTPIPQIVYVQPSPIVIYVQPSVSPTLTSTPQPTPTPDTKPPQIGVFYVTNFDDGRKENLYYSGDINGHCQMCMLITSNEPIDISLSYILVKESSEEFNKIKPVMYFLSDKIAEIAQTQEKILALEYKGFGISQINNQTLRDRHFYTASLPAGTNTLFFFKINAQDKSGNKYSDTWSNWDGDHKVYIW